MIYSIGHDIVENTRITQIIEKYGDRFINKILTEEEKHQLANRHDKVRFLAKRFAAKEAFGKACGTGLRTPILMKHISVVNDSNGKPFFKFATEIEGKYKNSKLLVNLKLNLIIL